MVFFGYQNAGPIAFGLSVSPSSFETAYGYYLYEAGSGFRFVRTTPIFHVFQNQTMYIWEKCSETGTNTNYLYYRDCP